MDKCDNIQIILQNLISGEYNESKVFQIVLKLSPLLKHPFPLASDIVKKLWFSELNKSDEGLTAVQNSTNEVMISKLQHICVKLAVKFLICIKKCFLNLFSPSKNEGSMSCCSCMNNNELSFISDCLKKSAFLIGIQITKDKFQEIIIEVMDVLFQKKVTMVKNIIKNFECIKTQFQKLLEESRILVNHTIFVLCSSSICKKNDDIYDLVYHSILEKLSDEMLRICDSLKRVLDKKLKQTIERFPILNGTQNQNEDAISLKVIKSLASLIDSFFVIENDILNSKILDLNEDCSQWKGRKGVLKQQNHVSSILQVTHLKKDLNSTKTNLSSENSWFWSEGIKDLLNIISESITVILTDQTKFYLDEAQKLIDQGFPNALEMMNISNLFIDVSIPVPKIIFKCVGSILKLIRDFLPFARLGSKHKPITKLLISYLDIITQVMKEIKLFLSCLIESLPEELSEDYSHNILSTIMAVILMLKHCGKIIYQDNNSPPFQNSLQAFSKLYTKVEQIIIQHQTSFIATSILQQVPKENINNHFSNHVQNWIMHCTKFYNSLIISLPRNISSSIFLQVFIDSLKIFADRSCVYTNKNTTTKQLQCNISSILHFSYNVICITCSCIEILDLSSFNFHYQDFSNGKKIVFLGKELFNAYLVPMASFKLLANMLKLRRQKKYLKSKSLVWLSVIEPNLFPLQWNGRSDNLSDNQLFYFLIRNLTFSESKRFQFTQNLLKMRNSNFSKKLLNGEIILPQMKLDRIQELIFNSLYHENFVFSQLLLSCIELTTDITSRNFIKLSYLKLDSSAHTIWQKIIHKMLIPSVETSVKLVYKVIQTEAWTYDIKQHLSQTSDDTVEVLFASKSEKELLSLCFKTLLKSLRLAAGSLDVLACHILKMFHLKLISINTQIQIPFGTFGACALIRSCFALLTEEHKLLTLLCVSDLPEEHKKILKKLSDIISKPNLGIKDYLEEFVDDLQTELDAFIGCTTNIFGDVNINLAEFKESEISFLEQVEDNRLYVKKEIIEETLKLADILRDNCDDICRQLGFKSQHPTETDMGTVRHDLLHTNLQNFDTQDIIMSCLLSLPDEKLLHLLRKKRNLEDEFSCSVEEKKFLKDIDLFLNQP